MTTTLRIAKLAELRAKTDQELAKMINNEVGRGLQLALMVGGGKSVDDFDAMEPLRMDAEEAYSEALELLPYLDDLGEQRRLEGKVRQLRQALDRLPGRDELPEPAAYQ
jgi:hypothetical protein